ncbi:uncharacterized protein LOC127003871 isoform X1 [Eriocheir sinensis]|uniref:uncharacterized protein LOC127003871 isoform X1 n=2 Tax=Eriocheir sinensis TaxID=95602 RepID=UPI0021C6C986|nr:uncharacterized protein LOC127003871 isoform X1 [Eriocheir sinensis]
MTGGPSVLEMSRRCLNERGHWRLLAVWLLALTVALGMQAAGLSQASETACGLVTCPAPELPSRPEVEVLVEGPLNERDERLIEWVRAGAGGHLLPPSAAPYDIPDNNIGNWKGSDGWIFYVSQVEKYFGKKEGGFFVEAGGLDGYMLSTTLRLEQQQRWEGLLVEPRPDMFEQLLTRHRKAHAGRFCLSEKSYPHKTSFWMSPDYSRGDVVYSALGSQLFEKVKPEQRERGSVVSALCLPLATLLRSLGRTHVDLWVLDVEGVEWGVLDLFPFHEFTVDMLAVERKKKGAEDRRGFISMVQSKGFTLAASIVEDFVFIRNNSELARLAKER